MWVCSHAFNFFSSNCVCMFSLFLFLCDSKIYTRDYLHRFVLSTSTSDIRIFSGQFEMRRSWECRNLQNPAIVFFFFFKKDFRPLHFIMTSCMLLITLNAFAWEIKWSMLGVFVICTCVSVSEKMQHFFLLSFFSFLIEWIWSKFILDKLCISFSVHIDMDA